MAAPMTKVMKMSKLCMFYSISRSILSRCPKGISYSKLSFRNYFCRNNGVPIGMGLLGLGMLAATPIKINENQSSTTNNDNLPESNAELNQKKLIQNAAMYNVNSSTALLHQAVLAMIHAEEEFTHVAKELIDTIDHSLENLDNEFLRMKAWNKINELRDCLADLKLRREAVQNLIDLIQRQLQYLGIEHLQQQIWKQILEARYRVNEAREKRLHYEAIVEHAEKLVSTSAEVAFVAGSEYASTVAGESLYSAQVKKEIQRRETERVERELQAMEVKSIRMTSKHAEKESKQGG